MISIIIFTLCLGAASAGGAESGPIPDLILVQTPVKSEPGGGGSRIFPPDGRYMDGCRIVRISFRDSGPEPTPLTPGFISARDPSVSFDGKRILFAGKREAGDPWQIWRMNADGSDKVQITRGEHDCVSPLYVGSLFYLNDKTPTPQIVYVGAAHGWSDGPGRGPVRSLYACNMDGSKARRISFNLYSDFDPDVLPNGRLVYSSWRPGAEGLGSRGVLGLLGVNIDGADLMAYAETARPPLHQESPRVGRDGRVYFIESATTSLSGGGDLAYIAIRRPLHSREVLAPAARGAWQSPCPLPDGGLLASWRGDEAGAVYGVHRVAPDTGKKLEAVYTNPEYHCMDAHPLAARPRVSGRSSVVGFRHKDTGVIYCLNAYISQLPEVSRSAPGRFKRVRIIEGTPHLPGSDQASPGGEKGKGDASPWRPGLRILGVAPVEKDGSFHVRTPAKTPLVFQLLDERGMAAAAQTSWSWVMNGESRGCIGCHEDPELSPPNRLARAVLKPEVKLTLPPERRRVVDFNHQIAPIINARCLACHGPGKTSPTLGRGRLDHLALTTGENPDVTPGSARKSPFIWKLLGEAGIPGGESSGQPIPCGKELSDVERMIFIEWADLGAP
ncbi:MAG: hypothetical protein GY859_28230 [Desulfobacterales bacterium]|nr:hypothetical protein [Desulfobacterales bacterium]